MSRKHFEALAYHLRMDGRHLKGKAREGWRRAVEATADACKELNPSFDRVRFLRACEVGP